MAQKKDVWVSEIEQSINTFVDVMRKAGYPGVKPIRSPRERKGLLTRLFTDAPVVPDGWLIGASYDDDNDSWSGGGGYAEIYLATDGRLFLNDFERPYTLGSSDSRYSGEKEAEAEIPRRLAVLLDDHGLSWPE